MNDIVRERKWSKAPPWRGRKYELDERKFLAHRTGSCVNLLGKRHVARSWPGSTEPSDMIPKDFDSVQAPKITSHPSINHGGFKNRLSTVLRMSFFLF